MSDIQSQVEMGVSTGMLRQLYGDREDGGHINTRIDCFVGYIESDEGKEAPIGALEINIAEPEFLTHKVVEGIIANWSKIGGSDLFKYVSIHAPSGLNFTKDSVEAVAILRDLVDGVGASTVVFHPQQILDDKEIIRQLPEIACVENMDRGKGVGRGVKSIKKYIDMGFGLVLDTKHAGKDKAGREVSEGLIQKYGDKIHHVHVSGGRLGKGDGKSHITLSMNDLRQLEPIRLLINCGRRIPIIHEGTIQQLEVEKTGLDSIIRNELLKITGKLLESKEII